LAILATARVNQWNDCNVCRHLLPAERFPHLPLWVGGLPKLLLLQMEDTLAADIAKLDRFDPVERALARTKAVQRVEAGGIACVDGDALIPIPSVHLDWIGHAMPRNYECASRRDRLYLYQLCWAESTAGYAVEFAITSASRASCAACRQPAKTNVPGVLN
jgi:hypothetical protein